MATIGKTNPHARRLRRESTDAEHRLWQRLRNRQLAGLRFRRQVTVGRCVADFACPDLRLIVEADGGQHGCEDDVERTKYLEALGWTVLRFWNHDVLQETGAVLEAILSECERLKEGKPSPCPLPLAGEGN